jgi:tetratricopeptide (TPR) repeat protein
MPVEDLLKTARAALKKQPRDVKLHELIAPVYEQLERYADALPHLEFMLSATPHDRALTVRTIKALFMTGGFAKAQQIIKNWQAQEPVSVLAVRYMALAHALMGQFEQAQQSYAKAYEMDSSDSQSLMLSGAMKLLLSDAREGYEEYSARQTNKDLARLFDAIPPWSGEPVADKKIILWAEQGIGDVVMFLGLLPWLSGRKADITLALTRKLVPLVVRSFPELPIISEDTFSQTDCTLFDYQMPMGQLIKHALPEYCPAKHPAYMKPDAQKVSALRERYLGYAKERSRKKLIGISWHTTNPAVGFARTITLPELDPLFSIPDLQFVSLQYGNHMADIESCNQRFRDIILHDAGIDAFGDIDALAAQIAAMDEVITIDNSTVHLAGALGVPATLMLSAMPDWRWGVTRGDCQWYGSVKLERQEVTLNWKPVLKRLRARLSES